MALTFTVTVEIRRDCDFSETEISSAICSALRSDFFKEGGADELGISELRVNDEIVFHTVDGELTCVVDPDEEDSEVLDGE